MRILVTGGSGYVGWHLIQELLQLKYEVISYDFIKKIDLTPEKNLLSLPGVSDDLSELHSLDRNLLIDAVIHLAAKKSVLESAANPTAFWKTNVDGSKNVARFVSERKIPILINASSAAVYGHNTNNIIDSTTAVNPKSVYGETKAIAEHEMRKNLSTDETNFYNLRFFNIAGQSSSYKVDTPDVNIFPQVANALRTDKSFKLNGDDFSTRDGTCIRDFIHVQDVVQAITSCLQDQNISKAFFQRSINICSGVGTSMLEVIRLMEDQAGRSLKIQVLPRRDEDPKEVIGDPSIFFQLIDNRALHSIGEIASSTWHSHLS